MEREILEDALRRQKAWEKTVGVDGLFALGVIGTVLSILFMGIDIYTSKESWSTLSIPPWILLLYEHRVGSGIESEVRSARRAVAEKESR